MTMRFAGCWSLIGSDSILKIIRFELGWHEKRASIDGRVLGGLIEDMLAGMRQIFIGVMILSLAGTAGAQRWSAAAANGWYAKQPWLVGGNYIPATAINELEMWQADTFDPGRIDLELGWAEGIGMNTIRPVFVLFDSCWDPFPRVGRQRAPKPGVHNSGWMQSPGAKALQDVSQYPRLQAYVSGVVKAFANDSRVLAWDIWNEPDNLNQSSDGRLEPPNKVELVLALLPKAFEWARAAHPRQPLTSGVWKGDWSSGEKLTPMEKIQLGMSDVISFHNYDEPQEFEKRVIWLQAYHRPILCTEYMARGNQSTFAGTLPVAKKYKVAAINWGLVAGKTQTFLPWDSWRQPYVDREPAIWFHEVFRTDGTPYLADEAVFIRGITGGK